MNEERAGDPSRNDGFLGGTVRHLLLTAMLAVALSLPALGLGPNPALAGVVEETGKICVLTPLPDDRVRVVIVGRDGATGADVLTLEARMLLGASFDCTRIIDPMSILP